jgi:hypothetical protein
MSNAFHKDIIPGDQHVLHNFEYANAATREADVTLLATDIGKVARQTDTARFWILSNHVGPVWFQITDEAATNDELARVSINDTTADYLLNKITGSGMVVVTEVNDAGNETLNINGDANRQYRWHATFKDADLTIGTAGADWPVNSSAPSAALIDGVIYGYHFNDSTPEGVGHMFFVPVGTTNITLKFISKALVDPVTLEDVTLEMYFREVPDQAPIAAWGTAKPWAGVISMSDDNCQYQEATKTLASQGLNAGSFYVWELVRDAANASDTLVDDWAFVSLEIGFS